MAFWKGKEKDKKPAPSGGLQGIKSIIAVASGKGGVGKSTVASNLAVALHQLGASVGLLDADIYGPSQPGMLGSVGQPTVDASGLLIPLESHGIHFVSMGLLLGSDGPVVWRAPIALKMIQQFLTGVAWGSLDYLLIDLPPGTGDVQLTLAQRASLSGAIIVSTPQNIALGIAKKGLKMFQQVNVPILGIVENMSGFICNHCNKETLIFKSGGALNMAKDLGVPYLGGIPLDPEIMNGGDEGIPVLIKSKESSASKAYTQLASNLVKQLEESGMVGTDEPENLEIVDKTLIIDWPDGHKGQHSPYNLRINCACALCISENTGEKLLDPRKIPLDIEFSGIDLVGRYAISAGFTDGHNTGIYTFKRLKENCECSNCTEAKNTSFSV